MGTGGQEGRHQGAVTGRRLGTAGRNKSMNRKRTSPLMAANLLMAASLLLALAAPAAAQSDYPNRPIRVIIPFPAGGSNDIVGRAIATQMGERLGKQLIIDNRTGAGGVIGTELASKSPPDGY